MRGGLPKCCQVSGLLHALPLLPGLPVPERAYRGGGHLHVQLGPQLIVLDSPTVPRSPASLRPRPRCLLPLAGETLGESQQRD